MWRSKKGMKKSVASGGIKDGKTSGKNINMKEMSMLKICRGRFEKDIIDKGKEQPKTILQICQW